MVYLARVPKYMGPGEAKNFFQSFGLTVARTFFRPESKAKREARAARGGNMLRKVYSEGWVEFERKSHAKTAARTFNGQPVGGKASYKNDIWNVRYLSGFKFDDLTEEEVYKRAMHEKKLRQQIEAAKADTASFLETVEVARKVDFAKKKKRERGEAVEEHERPVRQRPLHDEAASQQVSHELLRKIANQ